MQILCDAKQLIKTNCHGSYVQFVASCLVAFDLAMTRTIAHLKGVDRVTSLRGSSPRLLGSIHFSLFFFHPFLTLPFLFILFPLPFPFPLHSPPRWTAGSSRKNFEYTQLWVSFCAFLEQEIWFLVNDFEVRNYEKNYVCTEQSGHFLPACLIE
jgi:hypothetical protein